MDGVEQRIDAVLRKRYGKGKKHNRLNILLLFIVMASLGSVIAIPFFQRKDTPFDAQEYLVDELNKSKEVHGGLVWHEETGVWHYWNVPGNAFGLTSGRELNTSYVMDWADDYFKVWLNASVTGNPGTWQNASEGLTEIVNWTVDNDTGNLSAKMSWIINTSTAPTDLYYRIIFTIDSRCKNFINGTVNGTEVQFDIPFENETVSFYLNWSDVIPLIQNGHVFVKRGTKTVGNQTFFWWKIQTINKLPPDFVFEIDPTFGNTDVGATGVKVLSGGTEYLYGTYDSPASSGTVDNITIKTFSVWNTPIDLHCALYVYTDNSSNYAGALINTSETLSVTTANTFYVFNFDAGYEPSIVDGTNYYLVVAPANNSPVVVNNYICALASSFSIYTGHSGAFPNPLTGESAGTSEPYIYASYTEDAGWSNTPPTNTDFRANGSVNGSTGICLYPQLNITTVDVDGNNSKIYWETNASGSWYLYQTNTSCLNATYYDVNYSNASAYSTTYWVRISINDTHDNTTRVYHFTTESGVTKSWQSNYSGYLTGGNDSDWIQNYTGYLTGGNATVSWQQNYTGWLTGGNATITWQSNYSGYLTGGNATVTWKQNYTGWLTGGNGTAAKSWQSNYSGWLTGGNISKTWQQNYTGWLSGGNDSDWIQNYTGWLTGGNTTSVPITLSNEYPSNTSNIYANQPTVFITINSGAGRTMNVSYYYGNSTVNATIYFDSGINITNGTHYGDFDNATEFYESYYWKVCVNDGSGTWTNETYTFQAILQGGGNIPTNNANIVMGVVGGLMGGLIGALIFIRRRRKE